MNVARIAVLGAGGFLGSHLVPALSSRFEWEIDAVDRDLHKLEFKHPRVRRICAHIEDAGLIQEISGRCEVVLSLTALCNPALYNTVPLEVIDGNYTHLVPLVKSCAAQGARLIHFSTSEVYGRMALDRDGRRTRTMHEDGSALCLGPVDRERWTYACAKQLLERLIWAHGQQSGLEFTIVRIFNVIGPRMDYLPGVDGEGVPRVLASFMNALMRGQELPLVDGGRQRRSFMAVEDLVEAIARIVERPEACNGQIVNLGHPDNDVSIAELARLLSAAYAVRVPQAAPARFRCVRADELYGAGYDDSEERIPSIDKAKQLLDWSPRWRLLEMLPGIVDDYVTRYAARLGGVDERQALRSEQPALPL